MNGSVDCSGETVVVFHEDLDSRKVRCSCFIPSKSSVALRGYEPISYVSGIIRHKWVCLFWDYYLACSIHTLTVYDRGRCSTNR